MKKIFALLVLTALISIQASGQERSRAHRKAQHLTAEQIATLGSKKMTLSLDLTSSQQKQVYSLLEAQAQKRIQIRTQHQELRKNKENLSEEDNFNFRMAQLDRQIAFKAEMKKVLTKDQYAKWENSMLRKQHQKRKKGAREAARHHGNRPE